MADIAENEWFTRALVRITKAHVARNPYSERNFIPGEELEMIQWGSAGRDINRGSWWTTLDIDLAYILPAEVVEIVEVISDRRPGQ